jgi:hypothetical protein
MEARSGSAIGGVKIAVNYDVQHGPYERWQTGVYRILGTWRSVCESINLSDHERI